MKHEPLEVIFCTDGIFPHAIGGMQRHSRLLIGELARDESIRLLVLHPHTGEKVFVSNPAIREMAVPAGKDSGRYLLNCYRYSRNIYRIIQEHPDAIVYSQGLSVWHNIRKIGNRVVVNPHGLESYQAISLKDRAITLPFRLIFRHLFRQAAAVVSLGGRLTGILQEQLGKASDKITVLPNAVNIGEETSRTCDHEPVRFLFVGRFAFNKGIGVLLEAAKQLNDEGCEKKMFFNLVGKGPLFEEFTKKYRAPNICFVGFADDEKLVDLYKTNDVFVLPTLFEGMPTVVLEAMSYGMPVIVTDVGATLELVDPSNGTIIEKNDVASLKAALIGYLEKSPADRKIMAVNSYLKVKENFTWPVVAEKHKTLFKRIREQMRHP